MGDYELLCLDGWEYVPENYTLSCGNGHGGLLRTVYSKKRLDIANHGGVFRFYDWLPVHSVINTESAPIAFKNEELSKDGKAVYDVEIYDYITDTAGNHLTADDIIFSYNECLANGKGNQGDLDFANGGAADELPLGGTITHEDIAIAQEAEKARLAAKKAKGSKKKGGK